MSKIYITGKALDGDFYDADFIARYEDATRRMYDRATAQKEQQFGSLAEAYRAQCAIAEDYMDAIFGDGTSAQLFGGRANLKEHMQAIADLTAAFRKTKKETDDFVSQYTQRQAPRQLPRKRH